MRTQPHHRPSLVLEGVTAGYRSGAPVVDGLDLELHGPALVRLTGSNGSGKSTFIELVAGYLRPWAGHVRVCGVEAHTAHAREWRTVCRTRPALYSSMTVHDHLNLAARVSGVPASTLVERAETYGLAPWLDSSAETLSTGNAKKLWFVCCTARRRQVVAVDEPFDGLDKAGVAVLVEELQTWAQDSLVLVVAHEAPDALRFDDAVTVEGTTAEEVVVEDAAAPDVRADENHGIGVRA